MNFEGFASDLVLFAPVLFKGLGVTVLLTLSALPLSLVLGLALAMARLSQVPALRAAALGFIGMVRGIPIIVQLFCVYFVLPELGINLVPFGAGVLGLGVAYSAYQAENFRAGFEAVDRHLLEAGRSLGMSERLIFRRVTLPLGLRTALPTFGNTTVMLLKDSSIASTITIAELTRAGQLLAISTFKNGEVYIMVGMLYLLASLPLAAAVRFLEKRFATT